MLLAVLVSALSVFFVSAEDIHINVGSPNTTDIFSPRTVSADAGDRVIFRFLTGNYSATQALFYAPCIPAHEADGVTNGFNSGFRPTNNGTAVTELSVIIGPEHANITLWFFDASPGSCGFDPSALGAINPREESNETVIGFERNAARLYGAESTQTTALPSGTSPPRGSGTPTSTPTSAPNGVLPMLASPMGVASSITVFAALMSLMA